MKKNRLVIKIEGTPIAVRLVPHATDPEQLVLKAVSPEAGPALCRKLDITYLGTAVGKNYFSTFVDRPSFLLMLAASMGELIDGSPLEQDEPPQLTFDEVPGFFNKKSDGSMAFAPIMALPQPTAIKALESPKCGECGCRDGLHWNFCPNK